MLVVQGTLEDTRNQVLASTGVLMHGRFPVEVERALRRMGWFEGRNVAHLLRGWQIALAQAGMQIHPVAKKALLEFGGLRSDDESPGLTCARSPFEIDPTLWADADTISDHSTQLGTRLSPIGEVGYGHAFLAMGEEGEVYLLGDSARLEGKNMDEAVSHLLLGILGKALYDWT